MGTREKKNFRKEEEGGGEREVRDNSFSSYLQRQGKKKGLRERKKGKGELGVLRLLYISIICLLFMTELVRPWSIRCSRRGKGVLQGEGERSAWRAVFFVCGRRAARRPQGRRRKKKNSSRVGKKEEKKGDRTQRPLSFSLTGLPSASAMRPSWQAAPGGRGKGERGRMLSLLPSRAALDKA